MINMKLLAVVTLPSIYYGGSAQMTFWEEDFTGEGKFTLGEFTALNMKHCGCWNVRKTDRSRVVTSMSHWKSCSNLTVWKI